MSLCERVYPGGLRLDTHSHGKACLAYILEGEFEETRGGPPALCRAGTVRFLPACEPHSNVFQSEVRALLVELDPDVLEGLSEHTPVLQRAGEVTGSQATMLARRLHGEFRQRDEAAPIAIEGLVLEILAESVRSTGASTHPVPKWLLRARNMIDARYLDVPSLTEIAQTAGVHPVHLSREFRHYFDCTVGEYMRKLRIGHASHLLASTRTPLAEIASVCGFADQSHFSSTFKRAVGLTPGRYRDMHP